MIDSSTKRIVCDTGPLISLEKLRGGYPFIRRLFDQLIVPPAVVDELAADLYESSEAYFRKHTVGDLLVVESPSIGLSRETQHLDLGERQAIALAIQLDLPLLIEEEAGRTVARDLGIEISGIAGQLLRAARQKFATRYNKAMKTDRRARVPLSRPPLFRRFLSRRTCPCRLLPSR